MNEKRIMDGVWSRKGYTSLKTLEGLGDVSDIDPMEVVNTLWPHAKVSGKFGAPRVQRVEDGVVFTTWEVEK